MSPKRASTSGARSTRRSTRTRLITAPPPERLDQPRLARAAPATTATATWCPVRPSPRAHRRGLRGAAVGHRLAQVDQPVAQLRGALELEVPGGLGHLTLETLAQLDDLVGGHPRDRLVLGDLLGHLLLVGLDVVDRLVDGGRRDAA